jgi:hypothetical protein
MELQNDRKWQAFRYVNGEMTDEERSLFELRLAEDEAACDAVEQAVELHEAIRLAASGPIVVSRSPWHVVRRNPVACAAAVAACLVLALSVWRIASHSSWHDPQLAGNNRHLPETPGSAEAGVSLAWAQLQNRPTGPESEPVAAPWIDSAVIAELENTQPTTDTVEAADATVPQWLLTAVSSGNVQPKEVP